MDNEALHKRIPRPHHVCIYHSDIQLYGHFSAQDTLAHTYEGAYVEQNKTYSDVSMQMFKYLAKQKTAW